MKGVKKLSAKDKSHFFTEHPEQHCEDLYTKLYFPFRSELFIWKGSSVHDFEKKLWEYQELLKNTNIKFAEIVEVECMGNDSIQIIQKAVKGLTLDNYIFENSAERLLPSAKSLLGLFSEISFYEKASIDLNLSNFVVEENSREIIYIDLTPPLIRSFEKQQNSFLLKCYSSLCFNQTSQVAEFICNLFKKEVNNKENYSNTFHLLNGLIQTILETAPDCNLLENNFFLDAELSPVNRSCKRAGLLYQLFGGKIEFDVFENNFKSLSLKNFT